MRDTNARVSAGCMEVLFCYYRHKQSVWGEFFGKSLPTIGKWKKGVGTISHDIFQVAEALLIIGESLTEKERMEFWKECIEGKSFKEVLDMVTKKAL